VDDLSRFLREAETQDVVITRHGKPAGVLIGFKSEDDWFDYRLEHDPRFLQRIDNPEKNWKFSADDMKERECWDDYMAAYEKAIQETATEQSPWYIIPADKKWFTRIAISTIILDTLKGLKLKYPVLPKEQQEKLEEAKKLLLEK